MKQTPEQWAGLVRRLNDGGCPVLPDHGYKSLRWDWRSKKSLARASVPFLISSKADWLRDRAYPPQRGTAPINIVGYHIRTPWAIPMLSLLPAPKKSSARYPHYCFPEPGPYYEGDWVINRYFARRKSQLQPGEQIEGVLVASSEEMIPLDIPHLARIVVTLYVFDSRQNAYSTQFRLPVNRRELIARGKPIPAMASSELSEASAASAVTSEEMKSQHAETRVTTVMGVTL